MDDELNAAAFQHVQDLYYAPKVLEELYTSLGCKHLSQCVFEDYHGTVAVKEERRNHSIRHKIRTKVLGRLSIFLARYKDFGRQTIYHQMNDLLEVNVYDHIEVTKSFGSPDLPDLPKTESTISVQTGRLINQDPEKYKLWISETEEEKLDYFQ
jgi:hypothetical protein